LKDITKEDTMEKKTGSRTIYENTFLSIVEDDVLVKEDKPAKRVVIRHIGAAAVIATTTEGLLILTRQYRYPLGIPTTEIPAGKKDTPEEHSADTVIRELYEETGYVCAMTTFLRTIHPCVGYSDETIDLYRAKRCRKLTDTPPMDDDESIDVVLADASAAKRLLDDGSVTDGKTLIALMTYMNEHHPRSDHGT
jgi:ADP-ribose pyrophosphatase